MQTPSRTMAKERGAVAVIVAISAVLIFGIGALAVELTDMFSRDRAVQTSADLAAFAGAQDLPNACTAFNSSLAYLNDADNGVRSDGVGSDFAATASQMSDLDSSNGEIEILGPTGSRIMGCTSSGQRVRVTTPPRNVKFSFGAAIKGASSGSVQGIAAVELRSFDAAILPLSLPANCPSGSNYIYVDNTTATVLVYTPSGNVNGPNVISVSPNYSATVPGPGTVIVVLNDLNKDPSVAGNEVIFDFHRLLPDGTTQRVPASSPAGVQGSYTTGSVSNTTGPVSYSASFSLNIPSTVQNQSGSWKIRALQTSGADKWTEDAAVGTLTIGSASSTGCPDTSTGNFGLLASPRDGNDSQNEERIKNFMYGIDHKLFPVATPNPDTPCDSDGVPYADGVLDDEDPAIGPPPPASCVDVKTGASTSLPANGFIDGLTGPGGGPGRLVGTAPFASTGNCRVNGDADMTWQKSGENVIDTALSCYLSGSATLTSVRLGTPNSLSKDVTKDPRFFYLPVVDTSTRPSNSAGGAQYWPIKEFRGAFITNEDVGGDATCGPDGSSICNGISFNGGTQIRSLQAFTFPLSALPSEVIQPGNGVDYVGGPKDFLLVE